MKPIYQKGMFVLCPNCDRDALEVVGVMLALTPIEATTFRPIPPTTTYKGDPLVSGCCFAPLLEGPESKRKFVAMRSAEGFSALERPR